MNPGDGTPVSKWNIAGMRGAAWLRLGFSVLILGGSGWAFIESMQAIHHGCMDAFGGFIGIWFIAVPLLVLGLLSLVVVIPLFMKALRGIKAALIFDALIGGLGVIGVIASSTSFFLEGHFGEGDLPGRLGATATAAAVVLLMAAEAAWLLSAGRGWRTAWRSYAGFAVLMVAMVVWLPLAEYGGLQHVGVAREYIAAHLIVAPVNTQSHVSREPSPDGGHGHRIDFSNEDYAWAFFVQHDGEGFRLQNTGAMLFLFRLSPEINSGAEARDYLVRVGVPAGNLGTNLGEVRLPMNEPYGIDAPAIGGRYGVETNGCVRLYFVTPLVIPDSRPPEHK